MWFFKISTLLCIFALIAVAAGSNCEPQDCSHITSELVYASNNRSCRPFRSICHLNNYNCELRPNTPKLQVVELKDCKGKCNQRCPLILGPTCGRAPDGTALYFPNKCVLEVAQCENDEIYEIVPIRNCPNLSERTYELGEAFAKRREHSSSQLVN